MADTVISVLYSAVLIMAVVAPFASIYAAWDRKPKRFYQILGALFAAGVIVTVAFFSFAGLGWLTLETGMEALGVVAIWGILVAGAAVSAIFYGGYALARKWFQ